MSKLYLYAIFHANLSFSSVSADQYSKILDKCYWPILDLVSKGYKLGLEFSSSTLSAINKLDEHFIDEINRLWIDGKCDVIGSSCVQSIFPLIPEDVNRINLIQGRKEYNKFFGRAPDIAFINEQTFSKGMPKVFKESGYESIIMDWDNAAEFNNYSPDLRYRPVLAKGTDDVVIPVAWNSSLNSFKFQRCIYQRLSIDDFADSVLSHRHPEQDRALVLYGTDWEIFDYRPGLQHNVTGEIDRIEKILKSLASYNHVELKNPSEILKLFPPKDRVNIGSSECPIPCKNRDDYNAVRWAVSGRDNVRINTQCHDIYNKLKTLDFFNGLAGNNKHLWNDLNALWRSDLRTKTTDEKHYESRLKIGEVSKSLDKKLEAVSKNFTPKDDFILVNQFSEDWNKEPFELDISFKQGEKTGKLSVLIDNKPIVSQCECEEFYRDGSYRRVKLVICPYIKSGYAVEGKIISTGHIESHIGDKIRHNGDNFAIETDSVKLILAASTGADVRKLVFPKIYNKPLMGYLPPVYYDHIGHSSDYYSGGIQISDMFGKTYNDTLPASIYSPSNMADYPIRIPVTAEINLECGTCLKTYHIYRNSPRVDLEYRFNFADLTPIFFRNGIVTINPEAFAKKTLKFTTVNGSSMPEEYFLAGKTIQHHLPVGSLSSARTCLGATEGWVDISDDEKGLVVATDKSSLYSVPMVEFEEIKQNYLFRLYHSISESDETGKVFWRGHNRMKFSFIGHNDDLSSVRKSVKHMNRNLICIKKQAKPEDEYTVDEKMYEVLNRVDIGV